jgi:hypothetical protein
MSSAYSAPSRGTDCIDDSRQERAKNGATLASKDKPTGGGTVKLSV